MQNSGEDVWQRNARQWGSVGAPLRPSEQDAAAAAEFACSALPSSGGVAVVLGVTPELARLPWPVGTRLVAVDKSAEMIRNIWPRAELGKAAQVLCGDWRAQPLRTGLADVVVGDGCYSAIVGVADAVALSAEARRILKQNGRLVMRFFVRPEQAEKPASVFSDLRAGRIGNFHIFKWRLAMALHGPLETGVRVHDVWQAWHTAQIDPASLARQLDWPAAAIATIEAYRGAETRYTFPTLAEARAIIGEFFEEIACRVPDYELGERCPTLCFRPKP